MGRFSPRGAATPSPERHSRGRAAALRLHMRHRRVKAASGAIRSPAHREAAAASRKSRHGGVPREMSIISRYDIWGPG